MEKIKGRGKYHRSRSSGEYQKDEERRFYTSREVKYCQIEEQVKIYLNVQYPTEVSYTCPGTGEIKKKGYIEEKRQSDEKSQYLEVKSVEIKMSGKE